MAVVVWWGGIDVIGGRLSLGELIAFNNYLIIGMSPILFLGNMLAMVSRADASAERMWAVLDTEPFIREAPTPHVATMQGSVAFENVSFRYRSGRERGNPDGDGRENGQIGQRQLPTSTVGMNGQNVQSHNGIHNNTTPARDLHTESSNGTQNGTGTPLPPPYPDQRIETEMDGWLNEEVLDEVSFSVEQGQQVALLGATGSGKSTLVHLIPRFYDVTGGQILIDGIDVREWAPESLRSQIGMVLQQNTLFSGTVRENIAYGRPDATLDEVITAAKAAQAHNFIEAMPEGYESIVEARGANLSGGQKQRIAIARALLIKPAILVLDDSTSAVDLDTEFKIQQALATLMESTTTFIVAQRINSVLDADQIIILDAGSIVATGTHRTLMQSSSIYQEIYRSQFGEEVSV
ncbi:ABC transporter ATP-binding protein/permease [Chloroflexi bacterium TSY]|nr:ABC transporter ATP-binding protein/permease [Chloroflexi bacterium TSY]